MIALPSPKAEAWRYSDLRLARALLDTPAPANDALPDLSALWLPGERRLLLAGGRVALAQGVHSEADPDRELAAHPLADLAATGATEGLLLDVPAGADAGLVQVIHLSTAGASHAVHRIRLGAGARLTLVESYADERGDAWANLRLDADVAEGARLERVVRFTGGGALNSERVAVRLAANATFRQTALVAGGQAVRQETHVAVAGPGARADVDGVMLGGGTQVLDAATRVQHATEDSTSGQRWRLVAAGQSQVSISGGVGVARDAQRTDASQSLRGLVLARTAAVNVKPELEIFADDVKCAHGCAIGELDRQSLFYLQSRGLPRAQAQVLLTQAFIADGLAGVTDPTVREALETQAQAWLEAL